MHHHICPVCNRTRAHENNGVCEEVPKPFVICSHKCLQRKFLVEDFYDGIITDGKELQQ